jgi:hypothetical protein
MQQHMAVAVQFISENPDEHCLLNAQVGSIALNGAILAFTIPRVLICSQLPADTTYPIELTLTLMDSPGERQTYDGRTRQGGTRTPNGVKRLGLNV